MRLRQLEYFIAICESNSFSAAAERLFVAQPSLSQQVKALELELGAELLERGRGALKLTAAGRVFLPQARNVLRAAEEARRSVRDVIEGREGEVHVLTVRSVASGILPTTVARWHSEYPLTVLRMHDYSHRRELEEAARSRIGDIAIGPRPTGWDGPVVSLGYEELVLVSGAEDSPSMADPATVKDLAAANWVVYEPEQGMSEVLDWLLGSLGIVPKVVAKTSQVSAAMMFAIDGVGVSVVPANAVPHGWAHHARTIGRGAFREIVAYTRDSPPQLVRKYLELIAATVLPLVPASNVPEDALRC